MISKSFLLKEFILLHTERSRSMSASEVRVRVFKKSNFHQLTCGKFRTSTTLSMKFFEEFLKLLLKEMPIPDFQTIFLPLLKFAGDGNEHTGKEAVESLSMHFKLSEDELATLLPRFRRGCRRERRRSRSDGGYAGEIRP